MTENVKHVLFPGKRQKRIIVETDHWTDVSGIDQRQILGELADPKTEKTQVHLLLEKMIRAKLSGYKAQDRAKDVYDEGQIVGMEDVLQEMIRSNLVCFYCLRETQVFYEYAREPRQWTLERMENDQGHNRGNVTIACLECNLRRRTMYHERFVYTKQAVIRKV